MKGSFGGPNSMRPMILVRTSGLVELGPPVFSLSEVSWERHGVLSSNFKERGVV